MKLLLKFVVTIILLSIANIAKAQQMPKFLFFKDNAYFYNPAATAINQLSNITMSHKNQWLGYTPTYGGGGAPNTQFVSFNTPIFHKTNNSGIGVYILNDNIGAQNCLNAKLSYAYHFNLKNTRSSISIGMHSGISTNTIDHDKLNVIDQNDPLILVGKHVEIYYDYSIGVIYNNKGGYYAGVSFTQQNFPVSVPFESMERSIFTYMVATIGYQYEFSNMITLEPMLLLSTNFTQRSLDIGVNSTYNNKIEAGIVYTHSESISFLAGYRLLENNSLKIGYGFSYVGSNNSAKAPTTHEFIVSYDFPFKLKRNPKKVIRTPRFRF